MDTIQQWGLAVIKLLQQAQSPLITALMQGLSELGSQNFYLLGLAFVYWCIDKRAATILGTFLLLSAAVNGGVKELLAQPRPFMLDPALGLIPEDGFGLPSGHAQAAVTFWGGLAVLLGRKRLLVAAFLLPLFIGLSRIYLGVHFPTDVIAGWIIGGGFIMAIHLLGKRIVTLLQDTRFTLAVVVIISISAIAGFVYYQKLWIGFTLLGFFVGSFATRKSLAI